MTQSPGQYRRLLLRSFGLELVMLGVCGAIVGYALARWCVTPTFQTTILFRIFGEQPPPTGEFAPPPSEDRHRPHSYRQLATRIRTGNLLLPDLPTLFRRLEFDDGLRERLRTAGGAASDAAYELSGHWGVPEGNAAGQAEHFAEIAVRTVNPEHGKIVADAAARLFLQEVSAVPGLRRVHCSPNAVGPVRIAPNRVRYAVAGALAGLLSVLAPGLLTLFLERRHGDLGAQLRKLELPVLGTVPEITPDAGLERLSSGGRARAAGGGGFQNTLRINLEHLLPEKGRSRVLLFTGANRKAGTSTVISAAALALAENGGKVLLVDGNLRKPDIHRIFHLDNSTGLTDLLNGDRGFDALVHRNAGVPGLDVLTGGTAPGASGELLNSPRLEELLRAEAPHYRYILVDSPAAPGIADPVILGKLADAALLIGDCRKAGVAGLRALSARLLQAGVPCGGVILNYFRRRRSGVPGADGEYDYHYRFRRIADD